MDGETRGPGAGWVGSGGVGVELPPDWAVQVDPAPGVVVVGVAPATSTPFRANAAVTVGEVPGGMSFREWQAGTDQLLPTSLERYQLFDLEHVTVSGLPAVRRLAHHEADGVPVTMQQWAVLVGGRGITLTVSVPTADLPAVAHVVAAIGASLQVEEGWRP